MRPPLTLLILLNILLAHSWYPQHCCQDRDCRPVPCASIRRVPAGWQIDGHLFRNPPTPSPDAECHACFDASNSVSAGVCLFVPMVGS
jgi:hypothetical protein